MDVAWKERRQMPAESGRMTSLYCVEDGRDRDGFRLGSPLHLETQ